MSNIAQLNTNINKAQSTPSGLVEWNDNSLNAVCYDIFYLLAARVAKKMANTAEFETTSPNEAPYCILDSKGLFIFQENEPTSGLYYNALGGGYWVALSNYKETNYYLTPTASNQTQIINDIEPYPAVPLGGQGLVWDGTQWAFDYIALYNDGNPQEGDTVQFDATENVWKNKTNSINIVQDQDYTLTLADDTVSFIITTAVNKKAYLPQLTNNDIGKVFNINNNRDTAGSVAVSYLGSTLINISPAYLFAGMAFTKAYRTTSVIWTGISGGYKIIKRG